MSYDFVLVAALIVRALIMRIRVQTDVIVFVHAHAADIFFLIIVKYKVCTFFT